MFIKNNIATEIIVVDINIYNTSLNINVNQRTRTKDGF
uniref:Uncharacterized protein n=1 Tax=Borrelia garinii subsp. bavariensis (strain ATCC BAA-2496 / DSM 23469 / PBi) TaxID=290434 RepID=A0A7I6GY06_BORGP|nr:hypothetical protein BGP317 [Borreliella bavariensis PBi]